MADWDTISALATAGGTFVLALATFSAVRSSNRSARIAIDLLYGDQDGGQRTVSRCLVFPANDGGWYSQIARHWNIDRNDPR